MMTDGNQTQSGDHFATYRIQKYRITMLRTRRQHDAVGQLHLKTNKFIEKEIRFMVTRGGQYGDGNQRKMVKM